MAAKKEGKRTPTVNVSFRLDPKTKYLVDLLARHQKRTITGVIEWALERAAGQENIRGDSDIKETFGDAIDFLWSTDEATRLVNLATYKSSLLDYDELRMWETILVTDEFWKDFETIDRGQSSFRNIDLAMLQKHWNLLKDHVAEHRNSSSVEPLTVPF